MLVIEVLLRNRLEVKHQMIQLVIPDTLKSIEAMQECYFDRFLAGLITRTILYSFNITKLQHIQ